MSLISFEYKQFLTEKILEYIQPGYTKVNGKINIRCPICGDSKKSSTKKRGWIYLDNDCSYYCFNCSTGMSGIKFLQFLSGKDYDEIRKEYAKLFLKSGLSSNLSASYSIPKVEPSLFDLKQIVKPEWKKPLSNAAKEYLHSRMVDVAPFNDKNFFSWTSKSGKEYILIDWIVNGVDAYFQLNDFKKHGSLKYIFPKNIKKVVYGLDNVDINWKYIILFEGVYDSLFVKNGLALGSKCITDYQLKIIKDRYPKHQIVIAFDNDESGIKSMKRLIEEKNNEFKFFKWFDKSVSFKDINEQILYFKDANMFADALKLENMIVNKLTMKMFMIQSGYWKNNVTTKKLNEANTSWKNVKNIF